MQVTIRGCGQEVGRSCYQVTTEDGEYLVDCGIKQAHITEYPDLTDLEREQIDGVLLTHAHVDHIGALPLLEARELLASDAPIIATRPTNALAHVLLYDSLKLHKMEAEEEDRPQLYTEEDVSAILDRIEGQPYGRGALQDLTYEFGDAGHLLGSAWLALEQNGKRVVFSGDLGGRSAHLREIADPPAADATFLESTYGDTMTHRSFDDARTELYETVIEAVRHERPVLIPTFAVGRAQEILQLFREREPALPEAVAEDLEIVYDGMITDSMRVYDVFATDGWINETLLNYKLNSDDPEPYLPECAWTPETTEERETLLDGDAAPVIVAPSGMLSGGWSPFYLRQLAEHYDDARICFPGYQAEGTVGRALLEAEGGTATVTVRALMWGEEADAPDAEGFDFHDCTIEVPTEWIERIDGLSGHAAANTLLQFARETESSEITLIHGSPQASRALRDHLDDNTMADVDTATNGETVDISTRVGDRDAESVAALEQRYRELEQEVASLRNELDELKQRVGDAE